MLKVKYNGNKEEDYKLAKSAAILRALNSKIKIKQGYKNRFLTLDDYNYIIDNWGVIPIIEMAKHLNKSTYAITGVGNVLKLNNLYLSNDEMLLNSFIKLLTGDNLDAYQQLHLTRHGAPIYKKEGWKIVNVPKFFEWYKDHIRLVPVGKYVPGTLKNYETGWFLDKVDADRRAYEYTHKRPWTDDDDAWLEMLIEKRATYKECSEKLKRTGAAIKRRCLDKKLPKPKRLPAKKWTREEFETLKRLWLAGYEPCIIAEELKYRSDRMVSAMLERYEYFGMHRQKFMKGESDVRNT